MKANDSSGIRRAPPPGDGQREEGLEALVAEYLGRLNDGETIDREEILAAHPDLGEAILDDLETFVDMTGGDDEPLGTLGDYRLRRQIGRGGMGVVYEAWENSTDRPVALKVLPAGIAADPRASARFLREAQTAGKLSHPNVVPVYFTGVKEKTPFYVMEYVEGETLAQVLARPRSAEQETETPFGKKDDTRYFANLAEAFADVADGLQHAHSRGVIHRDIKPSNLILDASTTASSPGTVTLRILDFGLARLEGQESLTVSGDFVGTPLYMSPEQARCKKIPIDHRTDIYSIGATMYEAVTGQPPFRGKDHADTLSQIMERDPPQPRKLNLRIPADLETIILKCLRKEAGLRYGTAEALAQDLRRFVRGVPVEARPVSGWDRLARRLRRRRVTLLVAVSFLLLGSVAAWLGYDRWLADRDRRIVEYGPGVLGAAVKLASGGFSLRPASEPGAASIRALTTGLLAPLAEDDLRELLEERGFQPVREAASALEVLAEGLPDKRDAHYHLARAYLLLGQGERAREEVDRTLEIDPDFVPAAALRAKLIPGTTPPQDTTVAWGTLWLDARRALRREDWRVVVKTHERLIELAQEGKEPYIGFLIEAHLACGAARLEIEDFERARENFAAARSLAPSSLEAGLLLGRAYALQGLEELSQSTFESLLGRGERPREETALWIVALHVSLKQYREALPWLRELQVPSLRERLRTYLLLRLGDWPGARKAGWKAVRADPRSPTAYRLLGTALRSALTGPGLPEEELVLELFQVSGQLELLVGKSDSAGSLRRWAEALAHRYMTLSSGRQPMNTRRTLPAAIVAAALAFSASPLARSAELCDDFSDGDPWDGDPVSWQDAWPGRGTYTASPGCLEIRVDGNLDAAFGSPEIITGDVIIRVKGSFNGTDRPASGGIPAISAVVHATQSPLNTYYGGVNANGELSIFKFVDGEFLPPKAGAVLDFDPYADDLGSPVDLEIELAATEIPGSGVRVDLRVWKQEDERPDAPTLSWTDTENPYTSGLCGVSVWMRSGNPLCIQSLCITTPPTPIIFRRGNDNDDSVFDISDPIYNFEYQFLGLHDPGCLAALDTNGDGELDISDPIYNLEHQFLGKPAPPAPYPDCGPESLPSAKALSCATRPESCP